MQLLKAIHKLCLKLWQVGKLSTRREIDAYEAIEHTRTHRHVRAHQLTVVGVCVCSCACVRVPANEGA